MSIAADPITARRPNPTELPQRIRSVLDPTLRHLFPDPFIVCSEIFDLFVVHTVLDVLERTGLDRAVASGARAESIVKSHGLAEQATVPLRWMIAKLEAECLLRTGSGSGTPPSAEPARYKARALAIHQGCLPSLEAVEQLSLRMGEYLRGERTGEQILFAANRLSLWERYFSNENLLYAVNNRLGAEALLRALPPEGPIRILELGAGLGSAAAAAIESLAAQGALHRVQEYRLTDVLPMFMRRAEWRLRERWPDLPLTLQPLDMDRPFADQGIPTGSYDLVLAVNALHVAKGLSRTLSYIRDALRPRGATIASECIRPTDDHPVYIEFLFNCLTSYRDVELEPGIRPSHGFLTLRNWLDAFRASGYVEVLAIPNLDEIAKVYGSFHAAAITARTAQGSAD